MRKRFVCSGWLTQLLGHKEDAIREGRRAVELLPVSKNAIDGAQLLLKYLALIYAWTGEKDLAFQQLAVAAKHPRLFELRRTDVCIHAGIRCAAIRASTRLSPRSRRSKR